MNIIINEEDSFDKDVLDNAIKSASESEEKILIISIFEKEK